MVDKFWQSDKFANLISAVKAAREKEQAINRYANTVANTALAQMAAYTLKGNNTASTATPADLTLSQLKSAFGFTTKYTEAIGNASDTDIVVTHNLGTRDVQVTVRESASNYTVAYALVECTSTNTITVKFASAPSSGQYTVTVVG